MEHYNDVRLNSAIGYITPKDMLAGSRPREEGPISPFVKRKSLKSRLELEEPHLAWRVGFGKGRG